MNWEDYGGKWAKADPTYSGRYYVIDFTNMEDTCGRDATYKFHCSVRQVDLTQIPKSELVSALESCGYDFYELAREGYTNRHIQWQMVDACHGHGLGAPMQEFTSNTYAGRLRADARRYAESLMADEALVQSQLDKPVNRIGSTARDFGRGDALAGLERYASGEGEPDPTNDLMLRLYGRPDLARQTTD